MNILKSSATAKDFENWADEEDLELQDTRTSLTVQEYRELIVIEKEIMQDDELRGEQLLDWVERKKKEWQEEAYKKGFIDGGLEELKSVKH